MYCYPLHTSLQGLGILFASCIFETDCVIGQPEYPIYSMLQSGQNKLNIRLQYSRVSERINIFFPTRLPCDFFQSSWLPPLQSVVILFCSVFSLYLCRFIGLVLIPTCERCELRYLRSGRQELNPFVRVHSLHDPRVVPRLKCFDIFLYCPYPPSCCDS
jgi:hypothetical protein